MFIPWKPNPSPRQDMPWNGPDSRPLDQYKRTTSFFSTTGHNYHHRWYNSFWDKPESNHYGRMIDRFVISTGLIEQWRETGGSVWYGGDTITLREAPYIITFFSVNPLIVIMAPFNYAENPDYVDRRNFVSSKYLVNHYFHATKVPYQADLQWLSPDLNEMLQPIGIREGGSAEIKWDKGKLILQEKDGWVISRRE